MDRIGGLEPLLIVRIAALGRKLRLLGTVEVGKGPRHYIAVLELRRIGQRLEEAPPHDLEAFLGTGRPPRRFHPAHHVAQPVERLPTALATHLHIVGLGVRRSGSIRGRQADHQQAVLRQLGRFGEHLSEGELRFEPPAGKSLWSWSWRA